MLFRRSVRVFGSGSPPVVTPVPLRVAVVVSGISGVPSRLGSAGFAAAVLFGVPSKAAAMVVMKDFMVI